MNENLLGNCRTCGRQVSRRAKECPECLEPRPTMTEEEFQYDKNKDPIERFGFTRFDFIFFWITVIFLGLVMIWAIHVYG